VKFVCVEELAADVKPYNLLAPLSAS
jgi:hypothetical protein